MGLVILTGCRDTSLKEKMSELETPTMAAFNILIDARMHAKATTAKHATSCGTIANKQKNAGWVDRIIVVGGETCLTQRRSADRS